MLTKRVDVVDFKGALDGTVDVDGLDRVTVPWLGNQLDVLAQLAEMNELLVVAHVFWGRQVDDPALKPKPGVRRSIGNFSSPYPPTRRS